MINWDKYNSSPPTMKPNRMLIPVNNFSFNDEGAAEFNEIYHYCLEKVKEGIFKDFVITKSGGFSQAFMNMRGRGPMWQLVVKKTFVEIIIRNLDCRYYRFQIGHKKADKDGLSGHQAFILYCSELEKCAVDLKSLAIENGEEVKQTIPSPKIDLVVAPDRTYNNAFHIDLNSAFNAGMMKAFPVLEPAIRNMYNKRSIDSKYKDVLNMTQGFMQSSMVGYRYAHISKSGYVWTNNKLEELTEKLVNAGFRVLAYNTDGIWCQSFTDDIYHDDEEGTDIGQWKADWVNCKVRFRSKGCYEIEGYKVKNDKLIYKYEPKFRGESSYERIKPREDWMWGDIYKGDVVEYKWVTDIGVVREKC